MLTRSLWTVAVVSACWAASKPVILVQPASQTAAEGAPVSFSVTATGNPAPTYQWQRVSGSTWGNTNCKTAICTFAAAATDNGAQFRAMVSNSAGNTPSAVATLSVNFLDILAQPASQKVWAATSATFALTVRANPVPIAIQWYQQAPGQLAAPIPGATKATYTTPPTTAQNDGTVYWVSLCNGPFAILSSRVILTVVSQAPTITYQPKNITAMEGATVTFTVAASAVPTPAYQWQRYNGTVWANIWGATAASYSAQVWSYDNGATFRALVTNSAGSTVSSVAILTVQFLDIVLYPVSQLVAAGNRATFWVGASGNPSVTYQWYSQPPAGPSGPLQGATSWSYTTPPTTMQNNGTFYWAAVTNTLLSRTSGAARLTVAVQDLAITAQPADQSANSGDQVTFAVAGQASLGPLSYQWYKNRTPIPGANQSTYYIAYAASADAGSYSVTVSNPLGTLTSRSATLTVASVAADLTVWPNAASRANSDPWIAQHHSQLVKMQPRVLVINFANGIGLNGGDNTSGGAFPPAQVVAKAQAFLAALKYASQYRVRLNPAAPAFLDPAIARVADLRDSNGHANSNLFPRGPVNSHGYPEVGYYQLFSPAYAPFWGFLDPTTGQYLTLAQAANLGYFHDIILIANQVDGNGANPPAQVTNNILEVASVAQAYDANLNPIPGEYVKNGVAHNRQKADMSQATSSDDNSMPWTGRSMRIYFLNAGRGVGCLLHSLGHDWEFRYDQASIYSPGNAADNAPPNPYMQPLFRRYSGFDLNTAYGVNFQSLYSGGDNYTYSNCAGGACTTLKAPQATIFSYKVAAGNVHYPPGAARGLDYRPAATVLSSIESFGDPAEAAVPTTYHLWDFINQSPAADDDCGGHFLTFWYQNMPGLNNATVAPGAQGQPILNWWPFMYY